MLHYAVEQAFDDLLAAWRSHHAATTRGGTTLLKRAEARHRLDRARDRMHALRLAVHPEVDELPGMVERVWCESLSTVVHLRWVDQHPTRPGNFTCPCGSLVPIDWQRLSAEAARS